MLRGLLVAVVVDVVPKEAREARGAGRERSGARWVRVFFLVLLVLVR